MSLDATHIRKYVRTVPVTFKDLPGEVLHVDVSAMEFSRLLREVVQRHRDAALDADGKPKPDAKPLSDHEINAELLSLVIVGWDYTDGGKPVPFSKAQLLKEPERFLVELYGAISDDINPNPLRDKSSQSTLSLVG